MVFSVVEAVPVSSKSPMGVDVRICTGERHGLGFSAPSSTKVSSLHTGRARGSVETSSTRLV